MNKTLKILATTAAVVRAATSIYGAVRMDDPNVPVKTRNICTTAVVKRRPATLVEEILEVTDALIERVGIEASSEAPSAYTVDAQPEKGGWYNIRLVRDRSGVLVSAQLSWETRVGAGEGRRFERHFGTVVAWRSSSQGKVNVGYSTGDSGSALCAEEFSLRENRIAREFLRVSRYLLSNKWEEVKMVDSGAMGKKGE